MADHSRRGRPRQYDPEQALAAALGEFRRRGYAATSLDHLTEATKMARPSLYAAFGSKRDIYLKAVELYVRDWAEKRRQNLFAEPDLAQALARYFAALVAIYTEGGDAPLGCPVLSVIPAEAASDPEMRAELAKAIERTDDHLHKRLRIAREAGQLPDTADIDTMANMLAAIQHSLALRARSSLSGVQLTRLAEAMTAFVLEQPHGKT